MRVRPPELYGIPISELARICRVSVKTATRWKRGQTVPPESSLMLLRGDLECLSPDWAGWVVRGDTLISPENWIITMSDVLSSPLLRAQLSAYRVENKELRDRWDGTDEQPLPAELPDLFKGIA